MIIKKSGGGHHFLCKIRESKLHELLSKSPKGLASDSNRKQRAFNLKVTQLQRELKDPQENQFKIQAKLNAQESKKNPRPQTSATSEPASKKPNIGQGRGQKRPTPKW